MLVNTLLKENENLRQDIIRLRVYSIFILQALLIERQKTHLIPESNVPIKPIIAHLKQQEDSSKENVLKENSSILNSNNKSVRTKDFKSMEQENEELFKKLFTNNANILIKNKEVLDNKAITKKYSSAHVNSSINCSLSHSVQKSAAETPINDIREDPLKQSLPKGKRKVHTPAQRVNYSNQNYNTVNKSFEVDTILSSNKKQGRSMSVPQKKVKQSNNPVILQQYKYSVKKSISHISDTILATRASGKARGALRNGPIRRRCENCPKLLAKGFSTANCACHKL